MTGTYRARAAEATASAAAAHDAEAARTWTLAAALWREAGRVAALGATTLAAAHADGARRAERHAFAVGMGY